MTLQQLNDVIAIAETGSFNRAAERLDIAQPSLTSAIKELEKELDVILFNRSGKGATLTAEGLNFLPYARSVIMQYQNLLDAYGKAGSRRERFAVSTQHYSFAVKAFVEMVKSVGMEEYEFAIHETQTNQVIENVRSMKSELGVLFLSEFNEAVLQKIFKENGLVFEELFTCDTYVYMWKEHPLAKLSMISMKQLEDYPCLAFEQGKNNSFYFSEEMKSTYEYKKVIKADDRATMLNLMVGLNGYTLCSGIISEEINGDDYVAIPLKESEKMRIGYIRHKGTNLSRLGEIYLQELRKNGKTFK